jgi:hypothetical protein
MTAGVCSALPRVAGLSAGSPSRRGTCAEAWPLEKVAESTEPESDTCEGAVCLANSPGAPAGLLSHDRRREMSRRSRRRFPGQQDVNGAPRANCAPPPAYKAGALLTEREGQAEGQRPLVFHLPNWLRVHDLHV